LEIANNSSGTHAIQCLIEVINTTEEQTFLMKCIYPHILRLSYNSNGTHIIQKVISCFDEKDRHIINNYIIENLCRMCINANSICVVKIFFYLGKKIYQFE
jgi:hypothetical protein